MMESARGGLDLELEATGMIGLGYQYGIHQGCPRFELWNKEKMLLLPVIRNA
jgi:hypothetical protein